MPTIENHTASLIARGCSPEFAASCATREAEQDEHDASWQRNRAPVWTPPTEAEMDAFESRCDPIVRRA